MSQIVETAQRTGATITGLVPLPTRRNVYCVIPVPSSDKDSREHFEVRTHKRLIDIHSPTPKTVDSLMRLDLPAGVDIEIATKGISASWHDAGLRRGERRGDRRDRDRGRPVPGRAGEDRRDGRLRGGPDRVRCRRRPQDLEGRAGPSGEGGRPAHRHLVEFRGQSELQVGETVTVESFEPGEKVKVAGISIGKGFQGTIKRTTSSAARLARLAQRPQAGLDRRIGDAVPCLQGPEDGRRMGGVRVTQPGLVVHEVDPERNLLLVKGSVPGPKNGLVEIREAK